MYAFCVMCWYNTLFNLTHSTELLIQCVTNAAADSKAGISPFRIETVPFSIVKESVRKRSPCLHSYRKTAKISRTEAEQTQQATFSLDLR